MRSVASAIVARSLELGISYLERSQYDGDDLSLEVLFKSYCSIHLASGHLARLDVFGFGLSLSFGFDFFCCCCFFPRACLFDVFDFMSQVTLWF